MTHGIDPALLLAAVDEARTRRGELRAEPRPLTYVEVAAQINTHSATFSRLKNGRMPGPETTDRLLAWLGLSEEELSECAECEHDEAPAPDTDHSTDFASDPAATSPGGQVAAILGVGQLSQSQDPETAAAVGRVTELLNEGAVGVSIRTDLNPDDMPSQDVIDQMIAEERWDELDALFAEITIRPRHVAIVDTAAFADARLTVDAEGNVSGPVAYEGLWTGDMRMLPYGSLEWADVLPIPIIWDRAENDHDGMVVGSITSMERQDGVTSAMRAPDPTEADVQAVVAAAGGSVDALPARYFARFTATAAQPLHVDPPDERGLRRIYGHAAPRGVCHRSDMGACFQYPGDVDASLRHFHTGQAITLDNGETIRVGAITAGGPHLDTALARRGVTARDVNRHREDSNQVFALVRAWEDASGLAVSGVLIPSVSEATLMQAMACAPSVELWPSGRGRTLVGVHMVPTPAWPVVASAGSAMSLSSPSQALQVELEEQEFIPDDSRLEVIEASLKRIEIALALLASDAFTDVPVPEPAE